MCCTCYLRDRHAKHLLRGTIAFSNLTTFVWAGVTPTYAAACMFSLLLRQACALPAHLRAQ